MVTLVTSRYIKQAQMHADVAQKKQNTLKGKIQTKIYNMTTLE